MSDSGGVAMWLKMGPAPCTGNSTYYLGDIEGTHLNKPGIYAYLILNLIGGLGMLVMLVTAIVSPKVHRLPTWYSFCVSWVLSAISYTFLFITAEQFTLTPIYSLCFIQSGLIYAMPPT